MSRAGTIELLTRYYAAFNAQEWDGMLDCLAEDVAHHVNEGQVRRGKALFREFLAHMDHCYAERLEDIAVMASEDGGRASAEFVVHGIYKATDPGLPEARGQTYVLPAGTFATIESGLISRITTYYNLADWTRQVTA